MQTEERSVYVIKGELLEYQLCKSDAIHIWLTS